QSALWPRSDGSSSAQRDPRTSPVRTTRPHEQRCSPPLHDQGVEKMTSKTVTIVGQGYVGLPLAQAAVRAGWAVNGLDVTESLVDALNSGKSHVDDLGDADSQEMLDLVYRATADQSAVCTSDVVVICVPAQLGDGGSADLGAVKGASRSVGDNLSSGTTVILESTTYPGTTDDIVKPILEMASGLTAGTDFQLAYSPERVDPGSKQYGIKNTPKLM